MYLGGLDGKDPKMIFFPKGGPHVHAVRTEFSLADFAGFSNLSEVGGPPLVTRPLGGLRPRVNGLVGFFVKLGVCEFGC